MMMKYDTNVRHRSTRTLHTLPLTLLFFILMFLFEFPQWKGTVVERKGCPYLPLSKYCLSPSPPLPSTHCYGGPVDALVKNCKMLASNVMKLM